MHPTSQGDHLDLDTLTLRWSGLHGKRRRLQTIPDLQCIETPIETIQPPEKRVIGPLTTCPIPPTPIHFSQRGQAWIHFGFDELLRRVLGPHIALPTDDTTGAVRQGVRHGVEPIGFFQIRAAQGVVQITMARRGYHHIGTEVDCLRRAPHATPTLHRSALRQTSFEDLIPSDDGLALGREVPAHPTDEPTLQLLLIRQSFILHPPLAFRTRRPTHLRCFISSDVDTRTGKHLHHLVHHLLEKTEGLLVSCAINVLEHAPSVGHLKAVASTSQFRVSRQCRGAVPGHFDFGNDLNVPCRRIGHHVTHLLRRVESTMACSIRFLAPRPHTRQFRPR